MFVFDRDGAKWPFNVRKASDQPTSIDVQLTTERIEKNTENGFEHTRFHQFTLMWVWKVRVASSVAKYCESEIHTATQSCHIKSCLIGFREEKKKEKEICIKFSPRDDKAFKTTTIYCEGKTLRLT